MREISESIVGNDEQIEAICKSLRENYYRKDPSILDEEFGRADLRSNAWERQARFEIYLTPWIERVLPMEPMTVADIGCGTGSSTAALCRKAKQIVGYEIDPNSAQVARDRLNILGLSNGRIETPSPDQTISWIRRDFPEGVHILTLIAVLEHMTPSERLTFLSDAWSVVRPGGIIVVFETPNRLTYWDYHTSQLPFFHMLPVETMVAYAQHSQRAGFRDVAQVANSHEQMFRWGCGISYHDFEIAFATDRLEDLLVAEGYETEPLSCWPVTDEERLLARYFVEKPINKPMGFSRDVLNLMFRKPWPGNERFTMNHSPEWITSSFAWHRMPEGAVQRVLRIP